MKIKNNWNIQIRKALHKINIDDEGLLMLLTLIVGISGGVIAVMIGEITHWMAHTFKTLDTPTIESSIVSLLCVFIAGYIITRISPETSGSGVPQTKIHYTVNHGIIKVKEWSLKLFVTILSLSSGVSLGREGPTVAVTAGIGSSIGQFFSLSKNKIKTLLAVGSAAGIAAAFNTPIAAVTFTLEEIVGNMNAKSLGPIIIGAVAATVVAQVLTGGDPTFYITKYKFEDPQDLFIYLIIGVVAAISGPLWIKSIMKLRETRITVFKGHRLSYIMTTMVLLLIAAYFNKDILGSGHDIINQALQSEIINLKTILIIFVLKFIFISLCYSSGISGGIFMPTLVMGSLIGTIIGVFAQGTFSLDTEVGAFALVGMGAFFAAVTRAPITSILMIFELTHDYLIMLPLMIANITSYLISSKFAKGSIYEQLAEQDGIHLPSKEDSEVLEQLTVEEAMIKEPFTLQYDATVKESMMEVNRTIFSGFPVLKKGRLIGIVSKNQMATSLAKQNKNDALEEICTKKLITVYPDQSLLLALHYLERFKVSRLLVISRLNEKFLVGIITAGDIVERFGLHIQEDNEQDKKFASLIKNLTNKADEENQE